uniref:Thioredoxin domain-containing protein n=1 Tax=viral metagenome TaxID=1070528 RepID=A0A6C0AEX3_9ZZZZ
MSQNNPPPPTNFPPGNLPQENTLPPERQASYNPVFFSMETVKQLRADDFNLDSRDLITIKNEGCVLILFYANNRESNDMVAIWSEVASQMAGPTFAAVQLNSEKKIAEAFMKVVSNANLPLNWAGMRQLPFILVYRGGYPQGFYNGERSVDSILNFALTLACNPSFVEHGQLFAGIQVDNNIGIGLPAKQTKNRISSTEYNNTDLRSFDPKKGITNINYTGTGNPETGTPPTENPSI